jgi:hypothetical protein
MIHLDIDIMENDQNKELFPEEFKNYIKKHNDLGLVFSSYGSNFKKKFLLECICKIIKSTA